MNDENKMSKKMLIVIFIKGFILLIAVAFINMIDSPKTFIPKYYQETEETESDNIIYKETSESSDIETTDFPIMINSATSEELQLIPDIGPVTAELIISYRNEHGTILDFNELIVIDGIGDRTIEILKEYCIIN